MPAINGRFSPAHASLTGIGTDDHHAKLHSDIDPLVHTWPTPVYKDADYVLLTTDLGKTYRCDSTSLSIVLTLPPVASCTGRGFIFKKTVAGNTVTIEGDGAETIDGAANKAMSNINCCLEVYSRGATWEIKSLYLT